MFDLTWIADLDADGACGAITGNQEDLREQELRELVLAGHWATLHDAETLAPRTGPSARGAERAKQIGGHGTPAVAEFACAELGALQGLGYLAAESLMRDALDLQHRHPQMWTALARGEGRVWKARKVARLVHLAGLSLEQAHAVDRATTAHVDALPWGSFLRLVEAEIIAADPAAAEQRRLARELEQFVSTGQSDERGLKTLIARAAAGDVIVFLAMVDRIAAILELEGDGSPAGARRARAVGILGQPARAVALLAAYATDEPHPDDPGAPDADADADPDAGRATSGLCTSCGGPRVDPERVRPRAVLHVRMSEEALRARHGVAVLENDGVGPITAGEAIALLGHCQVSVRPILDLREQLPVDAYEVPAAMRDAVRLSRLSSVFPWTSGRGASVDFDHTVPYLDPADGGPPGQTRVDNLGPMVRFGHRVKTHGRGWKHRQPAPGVYLWRTPHGYWFRTDRTGTHALGRAPSRCRRR